MQLSSVNLELLRSRPFRTELDLFVFQPRAVMQCQLNNANAAKGDRTLPYDNVTMGDFSSVEAGMTLLVGSSSGARDIGTIRLKSATSSQFVVAENSNIKWQDGQYLTVLRYWDLWTVFPRISQNPTNNEEVIFYKDYDVAYVNQNFHLGTFVNAGPHRPVLIENGTGSAYYSSTGTLNLLESPLAYDWAFEGGNPTGSVSANPGTVYYTAPGDYVTRLIVTDTVNGNTDTTYRYVSVRNILGNGNSTPITRWEMSNLSGSRDEGGYSVEFKIYDPLIQLDEHSLIMLRSRDWFGNTKQSLGGNYPNHPEIFFTGYIESGSIKYNAVYNYITFRVVSITGMMKKLTGFSVSVESKQNPAYWYELRDMDCRRALYHYLNWHSTILSIVDFSFIGSDRKIQFFDVDRTSVFDGVDNLMKSALMGRISSDRQGRLWADVDPPGYINPTGSFFPVMEITKRDWMGEPSMDEAIYDSVSYIEMGGIAYSGANTGSFTALLSGAPGSAPSHHGAVERIQGLALEGQDQLNALSGNLWAHKNQRFPALSMQMANPARNLDIAPQEVVLVKINREDTIRDEQIGGIYSPILMSWDYSPQNKTLLPKIDLLGVVSGNPGDTILIPPEVSDSFDFDFPNFSFPPLPPFYMPGLPSISPTAVGGMIISVKNVGLFFTDNWASESPTWQSANSNLPDVRNLRCMETLLGGQTLIQVSGTSVWTTEQPGSTWTQIFDVARITNIEGYPFPREPVIAASAFNRKSGAVLVFGSLNVSIFNTRLVYPWYGDSSGVERASSVYTQIISTSSEEGNLTFGDSKWVYSFKADSEDSAYAIYSPNGASKLADGGFTETAGTDPSLSTRSIESEMVVAYKVDESPTTNAYLSTDNGASWLRITGATLPYKEEGGTDRFESIMTNGDGTQIVIAANAASLGLVTSINGGVSWTSGTAGSSGTTCVWHLGGSTYAYGDHRGVWQIDDLYLSTGSIDKTGNLRNLITGSMRVISMRHY